MTIYFFFEFFEIFLFQEIMIQPKEIISLMREITGFISRYRVIVNKDYIDYYFEIIKIAEEKISSA